ncbi:13920_t:CDS:2 [Funneliformis geosporum]|uniref:18456_t:CDS:1 n=1 Tax=Funneliformis geosporum TaxID=1117311 RepID=A0A9W4SHM0_9GLOM|nr:13920_t:CDS:2 [Funneliformis geosporum]CAI2169271.1 18456_t:CDS:2 [Funneliformis geosporum]
MNSSVMELPEKISPRHQSIPLFTTTSFNGTIDVETINSREFNPNPKRFTMPAPGSLGRRGYQKPTKPREFAKSAKKRQSVLALGSITHLQHFYAKRGIIIKPKKPKHVEEAEKKKMALTYITSKLDVETDPEVLLAICHGDIQAMLDAWCMVTGEVKAEENPVPVDILAAIETTTKAVQSVKNYSLFKEDLSAESMSKIRATALEVLEMISDLEQSHRDDDDSSSEDGHIYKESNFHCLDSQRDILRRYLVVVEECLLFDDCDVYPPNTSYFKNSSVSSDDESKQGTTPFTPPLSPGHPNNDWVNPDVFGDNVFARYHAFLEVHRPSKSKRFPDYTPLPNPSLDKTEFLASLADGKLLCFIYNTIVRRSKRPFGFIDKIHEDTSRTYRATENLKFFAAAAKFRFELKFDEFNVTEIVKLTNVGKAQLERILEVFCEKSMQELISTGSYKQYPGSRISSMYMQESLSNSQMQLLQQATTNSANDLAAAVSAKLSIRSYRYASSTSSSSSTLSRKTSDDEIKN